MEGHQRRKQHSSQKKKKKKNTWETILIQKISRKTVNIKKNKKTKELFEDFNLSTFVNI